MKHLEIQNDLSMPESPFNLAGQTVRQDDPPKRELPDTQTRHAGTLQHSS